MGLEIISSSLFTDANLKAYYRLENTDDSKGSNTLTNNNSVTFTQANFRNGGNFGTANTDKSLDVLNNLGIDGGDVSISLWAKLNTEITSGVYGFAGVSGSVTMTNVSIRYNYNSGTPQLSFVRTKNTVANQISTYTITLGTNLWYHIVLTYDGTNIRGYVNGALQAGPTAASGNGASGAPNVFCIGADDAGTGIGTYDPQQFASATIDDVAVFNRALTATEISNIYNSNSGFMGGMI